MSATLTIKQAWTDGKRYHIVGSIALSGNYVTGGIPLNLSPAGPNSTPINAPPTTQPIVHSDVTGKGGYYGYSSGSLYDYRYVAAPSNDPTFLSDGLLRIFLNGTELSATAIPAGALSDTVFFYGIFQKY